MILDRSLRFSDSFKYGGKASAEWSKGELFHKSVWKNKKVFLMQIIVIFIFFNNMT